MDTVEVAVDANTRGAGVMYIHTVNGQKSVVIGASRVELEDWRP